MKFELTNGDLKKHSDSCLIVALFKENVLSHSAQKIDQLTKGYISRLLKQKDFEANFNHTLLLYQLPNLLHERVLLVGCGKKEILTKQEFKKININVFKFLRTTNLTKVTSFLSELLVEDADLSWKIKNMVEASQEGYYRFDQFKSEKQKPALQQVNIQIDQPKNMQAFQNSLHQGLAIAEGVTLTKNIANLPSNICTPTYLANAAKNLAKNYKNISLKILEEKEMAKLGMNALLSVSKGSIENAKLICLEYKGKAKSQPIVFVGKGITFDTGGVSLKPADAMIGMKYDMCGAATVLGVIKASAELKLPLNIVGVIASAENMPSGSASKPEDIVTSLSGQTIEILNTDAEGRLVLCDALTYSERKYKPDTIIDIATLTGAVVIALGHHASGLLSNDDDLAKSLLKAGQESCDRAWQLPLWEEYQEQLKSPFADMTNTGGRVAGTITAACFLSRFTEKLPWAHLDVAGTAAMMGGNDRYATGRPVPLLMQYLLDRCEK